MLKRASGQKPENGDVVFKFTCGISDLCPLETILMNFSKKVGVVFLISTPETHAAKTI